MKAGNWKDAYQGFSASALDPQSDPTKVGEDLSNALQCLANLGREDESDAVREKAIAAHAAHWRLLCAAAESYLYANHNGFLIAGEFKRGGHRGGGKWVNAVERDRVRALQLMQQAMALLRRGAEPQGCRGISTGSFRSSSTGYRASLLEAAGADRFDHAARL